MLLALYYFYRDKNCPVHKWGSLKKFIKLFVCTITYIVVSCIDTDTDFTESHFMILFVVAELVSLHYLLKELFCICGQIFPCCKHLKCCLYAVSIHHKFLSRRFLCLVQGLVNYILQHHIIKYYWIRSLGILVASLMCCL